MKLVWTKRGIKRLQSAFDYIADNFYIDYALHFNMVGEGQHYVFLDEVQVVPDFERFI